MLKFRVQSGLWLGAAMLAAIFWLPPSGLLLILLAVCGVATWEFYNLLDAAEIPNFRFIGLFSGLAMILATWMSLGHTGGAHADGEWLVLVATAMLIFVRQFPQKHNDRPLETMAGTLLGILYAPFLLNFFTRLCAGWGGGEGRWLVLYLVVVVKSSDVGAYFVGCARGKHKMFPRISPAKSWEGSVGGVLMGLAASFMYCQIMGWDLDVVSLGYGDALVLGVALPIAGVVGDLAESLLKRAAGVKDSGATIQGMGGLLDILDSLLFAAPALYVYVRFFLD